MDMTHGRLGLSVCFTFRFVDDGRYLSEEWIERIVIAGLDSAPSRVESAGSPLEFQYDAARNVLVLRKPSLVVTKEWQVSIV